MPHTLIRPLAASVLALGLLVTGCTPGGDAGGTATPGGPNSPVQGQPIYDVDQVQSTLDTLVAEAGTEKILRLTVGPEKVQIMAPADPAAETTEAVVLGAALGGELEDPIPTPLVLDFANDLMSASEIDLAGVLTGEFGCDKPIITLTSAGWQVRQVIEFCDPALQAHWLGDPDPIVFDLGDADFITSAIEKMTAGSSGELYGLMLLENAPNRVTDGSSPSTYSNIQLGVPDGPERTRHITMNDTGVVGATGTIEDPGFSLPTFTLADLDIPGLLACSAKLREQSGATAGSVYVSRQVSGEISYQWRDGEGSPYATDTACNPL